MGARAFYRGPLVHFPTTQMTLITLLGHPQDEVRKHAWDRFLRPYYRPIRSFFEYHRSIHRNDVDYCTQQFISHNMFENTLPTKYKKGKKKFRNYLFASLCNFVKDYLGKKQKQRNRTGEIPVSVLEAPSWSGEFGGDVFDVMGTKGQLAKDNPEGEQVFLYHCAVSQLKRAIGMAGRRCRRTNKHEEWKAFLYGWLIPLYSENRSPKPREIAEKVGVYPAYKAIRECKKGGREVMLALREVIREEVPEEKVEDEIHDLFNTLEKGI